MIVDLGKAREGDVVHFRCGGGALIGEISFIDGFYKVFFIGQREPDDYRKNGRYSTEVHLFDIIKVIPKKEKGLFDRLKDPEDISDDSKYNCERSEQKCKQAEVIES